MDILKDNTAVSRAQTPANSWSKWNMLHLRPSAMVEVFVGIGVGLIADHFLTGGSRFWDWSPHPFWLVVILISGQYGTREGLFAAAIASLGLLFQNIPEQSVSQNIYQYTWLVVYRPLLWSTVAILLGALRDRQNMERDELRQELETTGFREQKVATAYEQLRLVKRRLESRLVGQFRTTANLYKTVSNIEELDRDSMLQGVVEAVQVTLNPTQFSVFFLTGGNLELAVERGWEESTTNLRTFHEHTHLYRAVVGEREIVCITNEEHESILGSQGVLAGPIMHPGSDEVVGMLKIEGIPFADLNLSTIQAFEVISQWIATLYKNAKQYAAAQAQSMVNSKTQLFSYGFFLSHRDLFIDLARRMGFELSMLRVHLKNPSAFTLEELAAISLALRETVGKVLRKTDLAFDQERSGHEFAIVLPGASIKNAQQVAQKLSQSLNDALGSLADRAQFDYLPKSLQQPDRTQRFLSRDHFDARLDFLLRLQHRVAFPITLSNFILTPGETSTKHTQDQAQHIFRSEVFKYLDTLQDLPFAYQLNPTRIALAFPNSTLDQAQAWSRDLEQIVRLELEDLDVELRLDLEAISQTVSKDGKDVEESWKDAERFFSANS